MSRKDYEIQSIVLNKLAKMYLIIKQYLFSKKLKLGYMGRENKHFVKELKEEVRDPLFRNYELEGKEDINFR